MPELPKRPCRRSGCPEITAEGYCARHQAERRAQYDREQRPERCNLYSTSAWRTLRRWQLSQHPACEICKAEGRMTLASLVHHVQTVEDRPDLALSRANLMSLCDSCHSRLHATEKKKIGRW